MFVHGLSFHSRDIILKALVRGRAWKVGGWGTQVQRLHNLQISITLTAYFLILACNVQFWSSSSLTILEGLVPKDRSGRSCASLGREVRKLRSCS
jgi:hypothetical protein